MIGRYGGEEFVILLPEIDSLSEEESEIEPVKVVCERLRYSIENAEIETNRGIISTTISLGIAEYSDQTINVEQLIDNADQALLKSKKTGRNRVTIWPL